MGSPGWEASAGAIYPQCPKHLSSPPEEHSLYYPELYRGGNKPRGGSDLPKVIKLIHAKAIFECRFCQIPDNHFSVKAWLWSQRPESKFWFCSFAGCETAKPFSSVSPFIKVMIRMIVEIIYLTWLLGGLNNLSHGKYLEE